jgi:hypothetical protein
MEIIRNSYVTLWKPVDKRLPPCHSHVLMVEGERQRSIGLSGWLSYFTFILIVIYNFIAQKYKIASKEKKNAKTIKFEVENIIGTEKTVIIINNINEKIREERYFFMIRECSDESFCSNKEGIESWG